MPNPNDKEKTIAEQLQEAQQSVIDLTARATTAEAENEKLKKENETLRSTNQQLFIRATAVAGGKNTDDEDGDDEPKKTLDEIASEYFSARRKKK